MEKCLLCNSYEDNELKFGELLRLKDFAVHHFCLLFAPGLAQHGDDDQGLQGFLEKDILKEHKRVKQFRCVYCENLSANLGCCVKTCRKTYHISCGNMNNAEFQFIGRFPTFCSKHAQYRIDKKPKVSDICSICQEDGKWSSTLLGSILLPCCKKWLHQVCLQKWARKAGSLFKCPLCNDQNKCNQILPKRGIFMPEKDADWELFDDSFQDFHEPPQRFCESKSCSVSIHMSYSDDPSQWKVCFTCGGGSLHLECFEAMNEQEFNCQVCRIPEHLARDTVQQSSGNQPDNEVLQSLEIVSNSDEDDNVPQRTQIKGFSKANKRRIVSDDEDAEPFRGCYIRLTKEEEVPKMCRRFVDEEGSSTSEDDEDNVPLIMLRSIPGSSSESSRLSESNEKSRKRSTFLFSDEEAASSSDEDNLLPFKTASLQKPCKRRIVSDDDDSSDECHRPLAKTGSKSNQRRIVSDDEDEGQTAKSRETNRKSKTISI